MFDGLKFDCPGTGFEQWKDCEALPEFPTLVSERTGEVLRRPAHVKHNGLIFKLTPTAGHGFKCSVEGSLHKFANGGLHNADAFSLERVAATIADLERLYHIDPKKCPLRNLEIGLNFHLPTLAKDFVSHAVSMTDRAFAEFSSESISLGKEAAKRDYLLKIYDKGQQLSGEPSPLLRVEVKAKKMRFFEPFGLVTLADLADPAKVERLGQVLAGTLADVIFYDGSIKADQLTDRERVQIANYSNPYYWHRDTKKPGNLSRMQRHRERQRLAGLLERFDCNQVFEQVKAAILPSWESLILAKNGWSKSAKNRWSINGGECDVFTVKIKGENVTLTTINFLSKSTGFQEPHEGEKAGASEADKSHSIFCRICAADISHQRAGSGVCSRKTLKATGRKCAYKRTVKETQAKRQAVREQETRQLAAFQAGKEWEGFAFRLLVILTTGEVWTGTAREASKADRLKVQSVARVEVNTRKASFLLTTQRAKALIRALKVGQSKAKPKRKK